MSDEAKRGGFRWAGWVALVAIVVGIVALALPSYHGYASRAQASEAVALLGAARLPLAEFFGKHKKWPASLDKLVEKTAGSHTQSVAITKGAGGTGEIELTATMKADSDRRVAGHTVLMSSADGGVSWSCRAGTMAASELPATCQN